MSAVITQISEDNWFDVTGVRQGSVVSPLLFDIYEHVWRVRYGDEKIKLVYWDDIALITKSVMQEDALNDWNGELNTLGMKIKASKTKIMTVAREKEDAIYIRIDGGWWKV